MVLQILLNDKYKLNHCKEMGAEPGRRFLIQPAAKLEPELLLLVYYAKVSISIWSKFKGDTADMKYV